MDDAKLAKLLAIKELRTRLAEQRVTRARAQSNSAREMLETSRSIARSIEEESTRIREDRLRAVLESSTAENAVLSHAIALNAYGRTREDMEMANNAVETADFARAEAERHEAEERKFFLAMKREEDKIETVRGWMQVSALRTRPD